MSKFSWMLSVGAFALATPAYAQQSTDPEQPTPAEASPAEAGSVDPGQEDNVIVVTAQGREQSLQDVPIAVNVVNAEALQNSGATDIRALNQLAPSLLISSTGSEANGSARIRGIGTVGDNPGLESSVAVFVDGVYRSRSGIGLNEIGEVDRIEVLRGPQGTLFGRNASAGLIHIISRRPNLNQVEGYAELSYGNYDSIRAQGAISVPLGETFAARLDAVYVQRDGFYTVVSPQGGTEATVNDRDRVFVRGQLLYEPNEDVTFRLIGDYTFRDESCCGAVQIEARESIDPTTGTPGDFQYSTGENRIVRILRQLGGRFSNLNDPYNRLIDVSPGRTYRNETEDYGISGQLDWDLGDVRLTSITAYREYRAGGAGDVDYTNVDLVYRPADGNSFREFSTFSQELRLQGSAFNGVLDWLVGGYYSQEDLTVVDNLKFGTQYGPFAACRALTGSAIATPLSPFLNPASPGCLTPTGRAVLLGQAPGTTPAFGPATPTFVAAVDRLYNLRDLGSVRDQYLQESENFALFTHNIINFTDRLSLTLGLRYTTENKQLRANFNNNNTICPQQQAALGPFLTNPALGPTAAGLVILSCTGNSSAALNTLNLADEFDEEEFSGTAVLSFQPNPDTLIYASYSRGYKAGGYNLDRSDLRTAVSPPQPGDAINLRFSPEINDAYELGFKLTLPMVTFSAAAFHQRFRDFQLNTFDGTVFIVQNINGCGDLIGGNATDEDNIAGNGRCASNDIEAGVTSTGIELEANIRPHRDININVGYTLVETEYADDLVGSNTGLEGLSTQLFLLPGSNLSNAPEHVATASIGWTPDIGNGGLSGLVYLDGRLTGDFNTGSDLFPEKAQDSFLVVNGRIGLRGPEQRWAIELWAQNLFNEDYTQVSFNAPFQSSGPSNQTTAQVARFGAPGSAISNQIFGAFLAEPRTYGITGRFRF